MTENEFEQSAVNAEEPLIVKEKWVRKARNIALNRLNRRDYASSELSKYLEKREVPFEVIQIVIKSFNEINLLNDCRFARNKCLALVRRGKGFAWIKRDLLRRGIEIQMSQFQEWVTEAGESSELQIARDLVERKYPDASEDRKVSHKAYQALLRRGFSYSIAREAVTLKKDSID